MYFIDEFGQASMNDLISVIVPVYKVEKYLNRCVESIVNQTYKNLEIILVDDGSPDNCPQMCNEWAKKDSRIKVIHKQNGGLSDARNVGISEATGIYITFVDSDDWLDLDCIEFLYGQLIVNKVCLAICHFRTVNDNKILKDDCKNDTEVISAKEYLKRILCWDCASVTICGKLFEKNLFNDVKFPQRKLYEDNGTTHKLILKCDKVVASRKTKYNYFMRNGSITHRKFDKKNFDYIEMTDLLCADVLKVYPDLLSVALCFRCDIRIGLLGQMVEAKEYKQERQQMLGFLRENKKNYLCDSDKSFKSKIVFCLMVVDYRLYCVVKKVWNVVKGKKFK